MKWIVSVAFIVIILKAFSKAPPSNISGSCIFIVIDSVVPEKGGDSLHYSIGKKIVSEREIDSIIDITIKETMKELRKKKLIAKSK
jgi:hypothetical protein